MKRYKIKPKLFGYELTESDDGKIVMFEDAEFNSKCQEGTRWNGLDKDVVIETLEGQLGMARREINNLNRQINTLTNFQP